MKALVTIAVAVGLAVPAVAQTVSVRKEALMHVRTSFDLSVAAPFGETARLFGPQGERAWAGKHWDPQFIHPQPAHDEQGAVFTVQHGPYSAVWVTTIFDREEKHFQYVYFLQSLLVTTIDVRFKPIDAATTQVNVVYARTAVTPEGNEHVAAMAEADRAAGKDWQQAIDTYLATSKSRP